MKDHLNPCVNCANKNKRASEEPCMECMADRNSSNWVDEDGKEKPVDDRPSL